MLQHDVKHTCVVSNHVAYTLHSSIQRYIIQQVDLVSCCCAKAWFWWALKKGYTGALKFWRSFYLFFGNTQLCLATAPAATVVSVANNIWVNIANALAYDETLVMNFMMPGLKSFHSRLLSTLSCEGLLSACHHLATQDAFCEQNSTQ